MQFRDTSNLYLFCIYSSNVINLYLDKIYVLTKTSVLRICFSNSNKCFHTSIL